MRLLLDTHALIWWLQDGPKLSEEWRAGLADSANSIAVSAVSILELAIKRSLGRLELDVEGSLDVGAFESRGAL